MRACGISLYRTALPMVVFALGGQRVPVRASRKNGAGHRQPARRPAQSPSSAPARRRRSACSIANGSRATNGEIYHYQYYDPRRRELHQPGGVRVRSDRRTPSSHARFVQKATYTADRATRRESRNGRSNQGWVREFGPDNQVSASRPSTDQAARFEPADYFVTEAREPDLMNFAQLRVYINELRASGYNVLEHEVGPAPQGGVPVRDAGDDADRRALCGDHRPARRDVRHRRRHRPRAGLLDDDQHLRGVWRRAACSIRCSPRGRRTWCSARSPRICCSPCGHEPQTAQRTQMARV